MSILEKCDRTWWCLKFQIRRVDNFLRKVSFIVRIYIIHLFVFLESKALGDYFSEFWSSVAVMNFTFTFFEFNTVQTYAGGISCHILLTKDNKPICWTQCVNPPCKMYAYLSQWVCLLVVCHTLLLVWSFLCHERWLRFTFGCFLVVFI